MDRKRTTVSRAPAFAAAGLFVLVSALAAPPPARGGYGENSGVRLETILIGPSGSPNPHVTTTNHFQFQLHNIHKDYCEEVARVSLGDIVGLRNDPWAERDGLLPSGRATFSGFWVHPSDPPADPIEFWLDEDQVRAVSFDIETGEDDAGCDFKRLDVRVRVCDRGEECFFCCDWFDNPCEGPTPYVLEGTLIARRVDPDPGTGVISGTVADGGGRGLHARIGIIKIGDCIVGAPDGDQRFTDNISTGRLPGNRGEYLREQLPFGNYRVSATVDGTTQHQDTVLTPADSDREVNFVFP